MLSSPSALGDCDSLLPLGAPPWRGAPCCWNPPPPPMGLTRTTPECGSCCSCCRVPCVGAASNEPADCWYCAPYWPAFYSRNCKQKQALLQPCCVRLPARQQSTRSRRAPAVEAQSTPSGWRCSCGWARAGWRGAAASLQTSLAVKDANKNGINSADSPKAGPGGLCLLLLPKCGEAVL